MEPIDDYLKCGICGNVLQSPRATSCGHVFCQQCLHSWIDYYGICPNRCGEVELEQLTRPVHIEKRISGLLTRCKNYRSGCAVQIPLSEKCKHEQSCSNREPRRHSVDEADGFWPFKRTRNSTVATRVSAVSSRSSRSTPSIFSGKVSRGN